MAAVCAWCRTSSGRPSRWRSLFWGAAQRGSINPARQFGPAAFARQTTELRIYLVAPIQGAALGAWLHHLLSRRQLTREVLLRASGEPPDGPLAAPRPRQAPRRSRSDGPTPPPQPPSGQCEWAVACRTW
ncbi:aquaporin [Streptomyces sp. NPDC059441]|uniref:aquaporin n=1 Tax=Streptomyces sp. NPDC059441 TaxID=3346829 RepID=UPI0036A09289